ncbi:MAG: hypothetical protein LBL34_01055 [Clostridiales bacterium]|jgi:hypothetical protein|nr:hypothetical protein [Clostridiales bacterium]
MAAFDFYEVEPPLTLEGAADCLVANMRMLSWLLHNLDGENICELNTSDAKIVSKTERLKISGDKITVKDSGGVIACEISPQGVEISDLDVTGDIDVAGDLDVRGTLDVRNADNVRGLKCSGDGGHTHGIPVGVYIRVKIPGEDSDMYMPWCTGENADGSHTHTVKIT